MHMVEPDCSPEGPVINYGQGGLQNKKIANLKLFVTPPWLGLVLFAFPHPHP